MLGKTQAECKEKLKTALAECKQLDMVKVGKYTLGQWMDVWFENYAQVKVRPSSHQTYQGYIHNHITPAIGKIPLHKLTTLDLQKFYKMLLEKGRVERIESKRQPKGLSPKTVRNIHQVISSALNLALEQKLILSNPANGCALPRLEHKEMKTLPVEQLSSFLREARESGVFELYYIDLVTGLRRGELLALKWEDIDFQTGSLRVRRQVARINGEVVEAPLKTNNAYRTIALAKDALEVLGIQRKKGRRKPVGLPLANRRPHVARQCSPHAAPRSEAGRLAGSPVP